MYFHSFIFIDHLECFVNIESQPDGVAEEEDEDDGEEESGHGGVPPVVGGDKVVVGSGPEVHQCSDKLDYSQR